MKKFCTRIKNENDEVLFTSQSSWNTLGAICSKNYQKQLHTLLHIARVGPWFIVLSIVGRKLLNYPLSYVRT